MNRLRNIDKVAYVRFASVYLDFKDVREFMSELKELLDTKEGACGQSQDRTLIRQVRQENEWHILSH